MLKRTVEGTNIEINQQEYEALKKENIFGQVPLKVSQADYNRIRRKLDKEKGRGFSFF